MKGDEEVDVRIMELVRGPLALTLKQILCHGLRKSTRIVSSFITHPWLFIGLMNEYFYHLYIHECLEEFSFTLVENKQNTNKTSRISLCETYRLNYPTFELEDKCRTLEKLKFNNFIMLKRSFVKRSFVRSSKNFVPLFTLQVGPGWQDFEP